MPIQCYCHQWLPSLVGRARDEVVAINNKAVIHRIMPLSLTIDHRLVTGGEAARFLGIVLSELAKPSI